MIDFHELHKKIHKNLPDNNRQEITARDLREVLNDMTSVTEHIYDETLTIPVDRIVPGEEGQVLSTSDGKAVWKDAPGGSIEVGDIKNDIKDIKSDINEIHNDLDNKLDKPVIEGEVGQVLTKTETGAEWKDLNIEGIKGDITGVQNELRGVQNDLVGVQNEMYKKIKEEDDRASEAERVLDGKVEGEKVRAESAEGVLDGKIEREIERATETENGIINIMTVSINGIEERIEPIENTLINGEGGKSGQVWTNTGNGGEWRDVEGGDVDLTGIQNEFNKKIGDIEYNLAAETTRAELKENEIDDRLTQMGNTFDGRLNPLEQNLTLGIGGKAGQVWTNTGSGAMWADQQGSGTGDADIAGLQWRIAGVQNELHIFETEIYEYVDGIQSTIYDITIPDIIDSISGVQNEMYEKVQDVDTNIETYKSANDTAVNNIRVSITSIQNEIRDIPDTIDQIKNPLIEGVGGTSGQVWTNTGNGGEWRDVEGGSGDVDLSGIQNDIKGVQNELNQKIQDVDSKFESYKSTNDIRFYNLDINLQNLSSTVQNLDIDNRIDKAVDQIKKPLIEGEGGQVEQVWSITSSGPGWAYVKSGGEGGVDVPLERGSKPYSLQMTTGAPPDVNHVEADGSFAIGRSNTIGEQALDSFAYGLFNSISGNSSYSLIGGMMNTLSGQCSIVTGMMNNVQTQYSLTVGQSNTLNSSGYSQFCYAFGQQLNTNNSYEAAFGLKNKSHKPSMEGSLGQGDATLFSIGFGDMSTQKALNAFEVMQNSDIYVKGVGGYDGENIDSAKTLQEVVSEIKTYTGNYIQEIKREGGSISFKSTNFRTGGTDDNTINFKTINGQSPFGMGDIVLYKVMTEDEFSKIQPQDGVFYYIEEN